ncbi:MAG: hypothetical protein HYY34_08100 [Chloroflexi bacterium]|nr:hypothetical protein [Chloroflexota bacterium]
MKRLLFAGIAMLALTIVASLAVARTKPLAKMVKPTPVALRALAQDASPAARSESQQAAPQGSQVTFGIRGTIDYAVRDGRGRVKQAGVIHNTVNNEAKNEVFNRIASGASTTPFDGIAALSVSVGSDDPANGVLAGSIALNLDGDSGTGGNQNPADGAVATDFTADSGKGTITVTFTAKADSVSVKQIVLTKATEDDTSVSNGTAIADADVFAYVDVPDVTLNTNDTVQYTWTVNVD